MSIGIKKFSRCMIIILNVKLILEYKQIKIKVESINHLNNITFREYKKVKFTAKNICP